VLESTAVAPLFLTLGFNPGTGW